MFRMVAMGLAMIVTAMLVPVDSPAPAMQAGLGACPDNATGYRGTGGTYSCFCSASAARSGSVWGTQFYSDDSSICRAAVHDGWINENGGQITFHVSHGMGAYDASFNNGVQSSSWGEWDGTFIFSINDLPTCPDNATGLRGSSGSFQCFCPAQNIEAGAVWGTRIYTDDSSICRAAMHSGYATYHGGYVTLRPLPGQSGYRGSTNNGIQTNDYGAWSGSFTFE